MSTVSSSSVDLARKLMRAVQYDGYGGGAAALKHVEVPIPTPKKNEVLVKVEAISINPVDWKIQKGMLRHLYPRKFPHIPSTDIAGEIVEIGAQVKEFKVGDKVVAKLPIQDEGGLAEFAVAPENLTVMRPSQVSAAEASALPVSALTAHEALTDIAGLKLDDEYGRSSTTSTAQQMNILVTAASGGVGHYAVQLAKLGNAHVTATCGARNVGFVASLGADEVLDYETPEGEALRSPSGRRYDAVVHCASGIAWSVFEPQLAENGKVIDLTPNLSTNAMLEKLTLFSKKQMVPLMFTPKKENLEYLVQLVKEGRLKSVIDSRFPLSKAGDAWAKSIDGHATGKILVEPRLLGTDVLKLTLFPIKIWQNEWE